MDPAASTLSSLVATQVTVSALIVYALEYLKKAKWFPWLTMDTKSLNRLVGALLAALAAVGIHAEFNAQAGTLLVTGLTAWGLMHAFFDLARSWVFQQVIYDAVLDKPTK
jgi:hypothetical protein